MDAESTQIDQECWHFIDKKPNNLQLKLLLSRYCSGCESSFGFWDFVKNRSQSSDIDQSLNMYLHRGPACPHECIDLVCTWLTSGGIHKAGLYISV